MLLNIIMSGIDKVGFFETKCPFGTYRESILRFFQNENSKTIKYYESYWVGGRNSVSYNTTVPRRQILMIRKVLDGMTSIKLVYDYDYLDKYFKKCLKSNKRFIVMHLGLPRHANCLIYDTKLKELDVIRMYALQGMAFSWLQFFVHPLKFQLENLMPMQKTYHFYHQ